MTTRSSLLRVTLNRATIPATCEVEEDKVWSKGSWPKGADLMKPPCPVSPTAAAHYKDWLGVSSAQELPSCPPWESEAVRQRLCSFSLATLPPHDTTQIHTHTHPCITPTSVQNLASLHLDPAPFPPPAGSPDSLWLRSGRAVSTSPPGASLGQI